MKKRLFYFIASCAIVVIGAVIVTKMVMEKRRLLVVDNVEALMGLELDKPIWKVEYITPDDYTCDPGGTNVCFSNE